MALNCDDSTPNCVDKMEFLSALDTLKGQQKISKSEIALFVDDNFLPWLPEVFLSQSDEIGEEKPLVQAVETSVPCHV